MKCKFQKIAAQQHEEIRALSAQLNEQTAQMQKVTAQVEIRTQSPPETAGR
jgi:septation ring formation regulator EzrA